VGEGVGVRREEGEMSMIVGRPVDSMPGAGQDGHHQQHDTKAKARKMREKEGEGEARVRVSVRS
jgi:hypothetical protein